MSDGRRTKAEYVQRYARSYTGGNLEAAEDHAIVIACCEEFDKRDNRAIGSTVVQSAVYGS